MRIQLLLTTSQQYQPADPSKHKVDKAPNRWRYPKSSLQLDQVRRDGIPKATQKQTDWCLRVWAQWAAQRRQKIVEESKTAHPLLDDFPEMTKTTLQFWLPRLVTEIRKCNSRSYTPNSLYQICCGLDRSLQIADKPNIDIFNAPGFTHF